MRGWYNKFNFSCDARGFVVPLVASPGSRGALCTPTPFPPSAELCCGCSDTSNTHYAHFKVSFQGFTQNLLILPWLSLPFLDWGQPGSEMQFLLQTTDLHTLCMFSLPALPQEVFPLFELPAQRSSKKKQNCIKGNKRFAVIQRQV